VIVYGDQTRSVILADELARLHEECRAIEAMSPGIERHGKLCGTFILAGELAQGIADADMASSGYDETTPAQSAIMKIVSQLAYLVINSWESGFAAGVINLPAIGGQDGELPETVILRQPEGYAHYALYPESYACAARSLGLSQACVIGVRSIGTSLSAIVAAAQGAPPPLLLRPVGHPFDRQLSLSPSLAALLADQPEIPRIVVDEGPGLSGSSFGAITAWLAHAGIPEISINCLPSHDGQPGAMANPSHKGRYARIRKATFPFDQLCLTTKTPAHRMESWFTDLVGPAIAPLQDISGGAWRGARGVDAPALPAQERRKFLLHSASGTFLLKFIGLGEIGTHKLRRSQALAAQGLVPEPLGLRHGFMIEQWHADAKALPSQAAAPIEAIGRYLGIRAALFPAQQGADLPSLAAMARHNTEEALGHAAAKSLHFSTNLPVRAIHVDARLHRWEWLALPDGRLLKADALDHSTGHDLIGCQDAAWDIAGAAVEFDLTGEEVENLRRIVGGFAGIEINPVLVEDCILYYCAFQIGLWSALAPPRYSRRLMGERKTLLFRRKEAKDFNFSAAPKIEAMAGICPRAGE